MKKIIILSILLLTSFSLVFSFPINEQIAKRVAQNLYYERNDVKRTYVIETITERQDAENLYYIFNFRNNGFVIVAADDAVFPVLGYSFEQHYGEENHPPQFDAMLESFKEQIIFAKENNLSADKKISNEWQRLNVEIEKFEKSRNLRDVSPLLSTTWDQDYSWNTYCPPDGNGPGGYVYAGCVAVATAQVMKYWAYPAQGSGSHSYYCSPYGTLSANFGATTYDWAAMNNSSPTNATRELLYHCGVAMEMDYSWDGSGAWVGQYSPSALTSLETYFGYDPSANFKLKNSYSSSTWESMLRTELDNGRPLVYRGYGNGGHAFNLDGYQSTNYFHFNWGWSGYYNGYYYLTNLNPGGYSFTDDQGGIFNLFPEDIVEPEITVTDPNGGENWLVGSTHNITWTSENTGSYVKIQLYKSGNFHATIVTSAYDGGSYTWNISEDLSAASDYKIKIIDTINSNTYDYSDYYFTLTAPATPTIYYSPDSFAQTLNTNETGTSTLYITNVGDEGSNLSYSIGCGTSKNEKLEYLFEDFEDGVIPADWTMTTYSSQGWFVTINGSSPYWSIPTGYSGYYACSNDDEANDNGSMDYLITPVLDLTNATSVAIEFDSYFTAEYNQTAHLRASVDGGYNWSLVVEWNETMGTYWTSINVDVSQYCGYDNVKFAFHSNDNGGWGTGWAIDNVKISGEETSLWLSVSPTSGSCNYNETDDISVNFNSADLDFGTYTADIAITSNDPQNQNVTIPVTLIVENANLPPVANAGDDQTVDEGTTVTLDGTGSYDPDQDSFTYLWTGELAGLLDDATSATPSFTAPEVDADTDYTFTLTVTCSDGTEDSDDVIVTVLNFIPPIAEFTIDVSAGFGDGEDLSVEFMDLSSSGSLPIVYWSWDFGDGMTASCDSSCNVIHTYSSPGLYDVSLTIYDEMQNSDTYSESVIVGYEIPGGNWGSGFDVGNSPFWYITGNQTIPGGNIINADNAEFILTEGVEITINGTLNADGAIFSLYNAGYGDYFWNGLTFGEESSNSTLTNCEISGALPAITVIGSSPCIDSTTIVSVTNDSLINAICYLENSSATIQNCNISYGVDWQTRAAVYGITLSGACNDTLLNNVISGSYDAGIYIENSSGDLSTPTLTGNRVQHSSSKSRDLTKAVHIDGYVSVTMNENEFDEFAYGIYYDFSGDDLLANETPTLTGNRVQHSSSKWASGTKGIYVEDLNRANIYNNTFYGFEYGLQTLNTTAEFFNNIIWDTQFAVDVTSSNINICYNDMYLYSGGTGNIDDDPLFVTTDTSSVECLHLLSSSPCIDAGNPDSQYNDPDGTRSDMGAFYYDQSGNIPDIPANVTAIVAQDSVQISWDAVSGATSYKVYSSDNPYSGFALDETGTFDGESWTAAISNTKKFFYVIAVKE